MYKIAADSVNTTPNITHIYICLCVHTYVYTYTYVLLIHICNWQCDTRAPEKLAVYLNVYASCVYNIALPHMFCISLVKTDV